MLLRSVRSVKRFLEKVLMFPSSPMSVVPLCDPHACLSRNRPTSTLACRGTDLAHASLGKSSHVPIFPYERCSPVRPPRLLAEGPTDLYACLLRDRSGARQGGVPSDLEKDIWNVLVFVRCSQAIDNSKR